MGGAPFGGGDDGGTDDTSTTDGGGGTTTTGTTGDTDGGGGNTSTEECRVMEGTAPVCCTPQGQDRADVDEVLELLNAYRTSLGIDAVARDAVLELRGEARAEPS